MEKGSYGLNRMNDQDKTKEQLTSELAGTRQLVAELKASEAERRRAENALQESQELSRGLLEAATVGTYIVQDGKFQYVNPQFERIIGYGRDELLGTYSLEHVHPDDRELVRNKAVELLKGQSILSYEFRFMHKDGRLLWILERVASIEYKGRPAAVGSFMDITERKQAEEALRESEERFRALIENASDAMAILDAEGIIVYESPSVERILGYRPEEMTGKSVLDLIHPDDLPAVTAQFTSFINDPMTSASMDVRLRHKDGSWRWMEGMANNLLDNPQVRGIVINYRDITERKQAEGALHQSEERLRALIENAPDGIHIHDLDARFIDANKKSEELVGYSRDELTSSSFLEVGLLPEEYMAKAAELLEKSRRGEPTGPDELELIRKDGSRVAVEVSSFPVQRGDRVEVINITRDITERKRVQEEMLRHSKRLEALNAISVAVSQSLDLNEMLNSALEKVL
ncbi:MAG: PAS domain S-box protein, partial [Dehalococcoidia bacterium]